MRVRTALAVLIASFGVAACSVDPEHTYWRHDSGVKQGQGALERDNARCLNEGMAIAAMNAYAHASVVHRNCMAASGWTLVRSS